jgi:cobalamin biosynthetic protein CobC
MNADLTPGDSMAEPIAHGGGLIAARRRHPTAPAPWIDLSTGINPVPYPLPALPPAALSRLPEPEDVAALEAVAAAAYGAPDAALLVAAPGTQSLIHLLPRLIPARRGGGLGPPKAAHAAAGRLAGAAVREIDSLDRAGDAQAVVVCNPNNPDGRRHPVAVLLAQAARLADAGGLLVVDEAFADLDADPGGESLVPALPRDGLVVLRSFGKTYGLAGLRLGFAAASAALARRIRAAQGPWAVSGPALLAGRLGLADAPWRAAAAARLAVDGARLDDLLAGAGCTKRGGTPLFRLVAHPDAAGLADLLGDAGILVRRFAAQPDWLRFGIPAAAAWPRLEAAIRRPAI